VAKQILSPKELLGLREKDASRLYIELVRRRQIELLEKTQALSLANA
jgi:hypothetical protein